MFFSCSRRIAHENILKDLLLRLTICVVRLFSYKFNEANLKFVAMNIISNLINNYFYKYLSNFFIENAFVSMLMCNWHS